MLTPLPLPLPQRPQAGRVAQRYPSLLPPPRRSEQSAHMIAAGADLSVHALSCTRWRSGVLVFRRAARVDFRQQAGKQALFFLLWRVGGHRDVRSGILLL